MTPPGPGSTYTWSAGTPASTRTSPSSRAVSGVSDAGLRITGLPQARAGASFQQAISSGKFHGTIRPTGPTGSRRTTSSPASCTGHDRAEVLVGGTGVVLERAGGGADLPAGVADRVAGAARLGGGEQVLALAEQLRRP